MSVQTIHRLIVLLMVVNTVWGEALHVPQQFSTIQSAINVATMDDVVLIAPGRYVETIDFLGKSIKVSGSDPEDWSVVAATVIDAAGAGPVVSFRNNETRAAVLTGLTLTGGKGLTLPMGDNGSEDFGGGILCLESSPTIVRNIVENNQLMEKAGRGLTRGAGYGGGIGGVNASPFVNRNIIRDNIALAGGGIYLYDGQATLTNNWIYDNRADVGGGLFLQAQAQLRHNTFAHNTAVETGGHLFLAENDAEITHNILCFANNGGGVDWQLHVDPGRGGMTYNNVWGNFPANYVGPDPATGIAGQFDLTGHLNNLSAAPEFIDAEQRDYHLTATSPCLNAGDPNATLKVQDTDIDGDPRPFGETADLGADEYPRCLNVARAGMGQHVSRPQLITLDGSFSYACDPNTQYFLWTQTGGPVVTLSDTSSAHPSFQPGEEGAYRFALVVGDQFGESIPDEVLVIVRNHAPIAQAGPSQAYVTAPEVVTLDGGRSSDPDGDALTYQWEQVEGPPVTLKDASSPHPTFTPPGLGRYVFALVVQDGLAASAPDRVHIVLGRALPVADAGLSRYTDHAPVTLDGSRSCDPMDPNANCTYRWRQIVGPTLQLQGADTATPTVSGFQMGTVPQRCTFELVVSHDQLDSEPDTVDVTIVRDYGNQAVQLFTRSFDPNLPTVVAFGGGNGVTGGALNLNNIWQENANIFTQTYGPPYALYADSLIVALSRLAPDYRQLIQIMGSSTGGQPAIDVAIRLNCEYGDPRYDVSRVALADPCCRYYVPYIERLHNENLTGVPCFVENYYVNNPPIDGTVKYHFPVPPAIHRNAREYLQVSTAREPYPGQDPYAQGTPGGFFTSVAGPAKNLQMPRDPSAYHFQWDPTLYIKPHTTLDAPGRLPEPVTLVGPMQTNDPNGFILSCTVNRHAHRYELLIGEDPYDIESYVLVAESPTPPQKVMNALPFAQTWWTVRAYNAYGASIYADPELLTQVPTAPLPITNTRTHYRFPSLGAAVAFAEPGDTIVLDPGMYNESLTILTSDVTIRSLDPNDPTIVAATRIAASGQRPTMSIPSGIRAHLVGVTITGATSGMIVHRGNVTLDRCRILDCGATGIQVENSTELTVRHCLIAGNAGAGIQGNNSRSAGDRIVLQHSIVAGNNGNGISVKTATIDHCTIVENSDIGVRVSGGSIRNSILYYNQFDNAGIQLNPGSAEVAYCNIETALSGSIEGIGIIDTSPGFVSRGRPLDSQGRPDPDKYMLGDYHLQSQHGRWDPTLQQWVSDLNTSACIDVADPGADWSQEPSPNGARANLGAYGNTNEASMSP